MKLHRLLQLKRPICFIDVESTGTRVDTDRILELAIVKIGLGGEWDQWVWRFNPGMPIPEEATSVHGITDDAVAKEHSFFQDAATIAGIFHGCDLSGYNARKFDVPIICAEMERAGVSFTAEGKRVVDTMQLWRRLEPRNLNAAVKRYLGEERASKHASEAHGALADTIASLEVLQAQLEEHWDELPDDVSALHDFAKDPKWVDDEGKLVMRNGEIVLGFGEHKGRSLREMAEHDLGYLKWILRRDFSDHVKTIVRDVIDYG